MEVHSGDIYRLKDGSVWLIRHERVDNVWCAMCLKFTDSSRACFTSSLGTLKSDLVIQGATLLTSSGDKLLELVADKLLERE